VHDCLCNGSPPESIEATSAGGAEHHQLRRPYGRRCRVLQNDVGWLSVLHGDGDVDAGRGGAPTEFGKLRDALACSPAEWKSRRNGEQQVQRRAPGLRERHGVVESAFAAPRQIHRAHDSSWLVHSALPRVTHRVEQLQGQISIDESVKYPL
jgi:hypothetical protein